MVAVLVMTFTPGGVLTLTWKVSGGEVRVVSEVPLLICAEVGKAGKPAPPEVGLPVKLTLPGVAPGVTLYT